MERERQRHYSQQEDEDEEEVGALQGRQSRHRHNTPAPASSPAPAPPLAVVSTHNGNRVHEEEVGKARVKEAGYDFATKFAEEEGNKGISTGEVSVETRHSTTVEYSETSEQWNVTATNKSDDIQTRLNAEVSQQNVEEIGHESLSAEETKFTSFDEHVENKNGSVEEDELVEEIDVEETEYDVERVIEKQNTHDLICPHCKQRITRTVVLRRRKRPRVNLRDRKPKPAHKPKPAPTPEGQDPPAPTPEREVLTCLSCFKFFIPKGLNGGSIDQSIPEQDSAAPRTNWFFDYFSASRYKETGKVSRPGEQPDMVQTPRDKIVISPKQEEIRGTDADHIVEREQEDFEVKPPEGGSESEVAIEGKAVAVGDSTLPVSTKPIGSSSIVASQSVPKQEPENISTKAKKNWFNSVFSSVIIFRKKEVSKVKHAVAESTVPAPPRVDQVVVDVETPVVEPATEESLATPLLPEHREGREWDVMKSVVYGGLVESITSLGVVSSAAAAGATTLNIFAMGLANLISGLFILGHNLRELKNEKSEETANQLNEQKSRYQEVLGRGNFSVHATLAVISYLVFGLLPPVIYGFSFRQSDSRDYKLAAVLGASLICIALLALAKSYVRQPPKSYFKTLLYYLSTGAVAACVSYLVGVFIKKLMERLGWLESSSSSIGTISFVGTKSMQPIWASY